MDIQVLNFCSADEKNTIFGHGFPVRFLEKSDFLVLIGYQKQVVEIAI